MLKIQDYLLTEDWFKEQATESQSTVCIHTHAHTQDETLKYTMMYFEIIGLQATQILFLILFFPNFLGEN